MKKLKIVLQLILFILIILVCNKVSAASITLAPNKSTVTAGDEFTISMNLSGASLASLNAKIAVDTSKVEYVSSSEPNNTNFNNGRILYTWTDTSGGNNPRKSGTIVTLRFRAKSTGTASFTVSGNFYDVDENPVNLSLSGTSITVNSNTPVTPPAEENNSGGTITQTPENNGNGNNQNNEQTPNENNNAQQPSANEGNNQNSNSQLSSNAYLSSLQVNVEGINPRFNKNTTNYYLIVDNTVDTISVNATPEDSNARVSINGNTNIKLGVNKINITVTAQNGVTTRNYIINVTKTDDPNNANANLENLAIEDVTLDPEFSSDVLEYSASVGSDIENLNILAVPEIEGANVNITGGDNLTFGNNIVTITVTAKDGSSVKIYTVNVYRKTETEELEEQQRLLEENNISDDFDNDINGNNGLFGTGNQSKNAGLWMLFVVLLIVIIAIVVYLIKKNKNIEKF